MPVPPRPSCPACGIAVTPGYQRCPKCHQPLPAALRAVRAEAGGATVLATEVERVTRWPWYLAGLAVLGLAVAVVVNGLRAPKPAVELPDDPEVVEPVPAVVEGDDRAPPPVVSDRPPDPAPIADRLARQLAGVRLYATVEAIDDLVEIRTPFCDDPRIGAMLVDVAPDLKVAGVGSARCRAPHGAEAWTRPLP